MSIHDRLEKQWELFQDALSECQDETALYQRL